MYAGVFYGSFGYGQYSVAIAIAIFNAYLESANLRQIQDSDSIASRSLDGILK